MTLDIATHHTHILRDTKEDFQQAFVTDAKMYNLVDYIIRGLPDDITEVPCPLCSYWQHHESLTVGRWAHPMW